MKISIITINFNNLEGLKKTVNSVLNQTYKNIEYIIIDGASTDGSAKYIKEQKQYFDYWVSEPDKGIYNAMNKGIDHATGDYLLFLNSGDILYDYDTIKNIFSNNNIQNQAVIYGNTIIDNNGDLVLREYPKELTFSYFLSASIGHQSAYINKGVFKKYRYDESYKIVSDLKLFIDIYLDEKLDFFKEDKVLSIVESDGISSNIFFDELRKKERTKLEYLYSKSDPIIKEVIGLFYINKEHEMFRLRKLIRIAFSIDEFRKKIFKSK